MSTDFNFQKAREAWGDGAVVPTHRVFQEWLNNPLTKALKQSHQTEIDAIEEEWRDKCQRYIELHDAVVKDSDRALDLLRRAETEMRYAGWNKYESDNSARSGVYEQIVGFLK